MAVERPRADASAKTVLASLPIDGEAGPPGDPAANAVTTVFGPVLGTKPEDGVAVRAFAVAVTTSWFLVALDDEKYAGDLKILEFDPNGELPWGMSAQSRQRLLNHAVSLYGVRTSSAETVTLASLVALCLDEDAEGAVEAFCQGVARIERVGRALVPDVAPSVSADAADAVRWVRNTALGGPSVRRHTLANVTAQEPDSDRPAAVYLFEEFGYAGLWRDEYSDSLDVALRAIFHLCRDDAVARPAPELGEDAFSSGEDAFFRLIVVDRLCKLWTSRAGQLPVCSFQALLPFACYVASRASTDGTRDLANRLAQISLAARREVLWVKLLRDRVAELPNGPRYTRRIFGLAIPFALVLGASLALPINLITGSSSTYIGSLGLVFVAGFVRRARRAACYGHVIYPFIPSLMAGLLLGSSYVGAQALILRLYYGFADSAELQGFALVVLPVAVAVLTLAVRRGLQFRVPESALLPEGIPDDLADQFDEWFEKDTEPGKHPTWDRATRVGSSEFDRYAALSALGRPAEALAGIEAQIGLLRRLTEEIPEAYEAALAYALHDKGWLLWRMGRYREAEPPTFEATRIREKLVASNPSEFEVAFAASTHNLAVMFTYFDRVNEALDILPQAVGIRRRRVGVNPGSMRDVASSLNLLGTLLARSGQDDAAVEPLQEAAAIRHQLADHASPAHREEVATALTTLTRALMALNRHQDALGRAHRAAEIWRTIAKDGSTDHEAGYVRALFCLSQCQYRTGEPESLSTLTECVSVSRRLAQRDPEHRTQLASCLLELGKRMRDDAAADERSLAPILEALRIVRATADSQSETLAVFTYEAGWAVFTMGYANEALALTREASDIRRRLSATEPGKHRISLSQALYDLSRIQGQLGRDADSLTALQEAVQTRYQHVTERPPISDTELLSWSAELDRRLAAIGQYDQAITALNITTRVATDLARADPARFEPALSAAWHRMGILRLQAGDRTNAAQALLKAVRSSQRCSQADLDDYDSRLGYALHNYGSVLESMGRTEPACSAMREAVRTRHRLAKRNSDIQNANLAASLYEYGWLLSKLGRSEEAVPPTRECVAIYQKLAEGQESYKPQLSRATYDLSLRLWETLRYNEALNTMRQGIDLQRELTDPRPSECVPELASFLETFSAMLAQRRLDTEAIAAAEEAARLRVQP